MNRVKCLRTAFVAAGMASLVAVPAAAETDPKAVLATYADIALAGYEDALATAKALDQATDALIANTSEQTLAAAREAWEAARIPYQQTEVYRFGNAIVDDWEGRVNAWPLDEGLIDYVDPAYGTESDGNTLYTANVIANPSIQINGQAVDASAITPEFLSGTLQEAGGIEANVATGYHGVEFLLWGQDLNGTGPGAGNRPHTYFDKANVYQGSYTRVDGSKVEGPSIADLVRESDPALATELSGKLDATVTAMEAIQARAVGGEAYDQQIGEGNAEGNATVQAAIDGLVDQTRSIERAVSALNLDSSPSRGLTASTPRTRCSNSRDDFQPDGARMPRRQPESSFRCLSVTAT
jgi:uncharacterized iron-regulated protein